jgi:predicted adenine nucleotide alpha hydrolase (AANH) superfamily ATPase
MENQQSDKRKKILVHICCSACLSYVDQVLNKEGFDVICFYYNPQVHGKAEYLRRKKDIEKYCSENNLPLISPNYDVQDFFQPIMPFQDKTSIKFISDKKRWRLKRCQLCNSIVMTRTFDEAKQRKIEYFTSTMLVSPYKDHDEIWNVGLALEQQKGPQFYYQDFRKGYWNGRNYAKNHHMLIPNYCGCVYSSEEGILE